MLNPNNVAVVIQEETVHLKQLQSNQWCHVVEIRPQEKGWLVSRLWQPLSCRPRAPGCPGGLVRAASGDISRHSDVLSPSLKCRAHFPTSAISWFCWKVIQELERISWFEEVGFKEVSHPLSVCAWLRLRLGGGGEEGSGRGLLFLPH